MQAARAVDVEVAPLQITQTFGRIEARASVQQLAIVHHEKIAWRKQETDLQFRRSQHMIEDLSCTVMGAKLDRWSERNKIKARTEADESRTPIRRFS
jgi:hypothetical protein